MLDKKNQKLKETASYYLNEYFKCKESFEYFCRNYILLELPGGDQHLDPYDKQIELVNHMEENKNAIILKTRQTGISTITQAYCAWLTVFFKNVVIGVVSKDGSECTSFARKVTTNIEKLPGWMLKLKNGRRFEKNSEQTFILFNGSELHARPVAPSKPGNTLRGKSVTFLIIDEAAFIDHIDDAWTSMTPAISTNQMHARKQGVPYGTVVLSTPNKTVGTGEWFYKKWASAVSGDGFFHPFIVYYGDIPSLRDDKEWYEKQRAMLDYDQDRIDQELELKFIPTEGAFLPRTVARQLQDNKQTPIRKSSLYSGEVWVFSDAIENRHYLIGVDTATEYGSDKSAIVVFDYETLDQVWEFVGDSKVKNLVNIIKLAAGTYPNCTVVIENNSIGNQLIEELNESEIAHLLYKEKRKPQGVSVKKTKTGSKSSYGQTRIIPGLSTNAKTRPLMIDSLYTYVTSFPEIIKSERLIHELVGLIKNRATRAERVEADKGMKDDIAMAASMAFYVRKYDPPMNINRGTEQNDVFSEVMDLNHGKFTDPMKEVKQKMEDNEHKDPFINVFDYLNN